MLCDLKLRFNDKAAHVEKRWKSAWKSFWRQQLTDETPQSPNDQRARSHNEW